MEEEYNNLLGKKALIVGGTDRIGGAIASMLVEKGVSVTVTGRSSSKNKNTSFIRWSYEEDGLEAFTNGELQKALSECDILCCCYGPFLQKPVDQMTADEWQKISLTNYALPGYLASSALKYMVKQKWGRILLFGGTRTDSVRAYHTNAAYAGAKTGISVLVKSIAMEYSQKGVTCNAILPGFTNDPPPGAATVTPQKIASKAFFLLNSDELNGVLLNIDNGWSL